MDGVILIDLFIVNENRARKYTYYLQSQFAVEKFEKLYMKGRKFHGKALAVLNQFKIKPEKEGGHDAEKEDI
jgi:hypothetical protein